MGFETSNVAAEVNPQPINAIQTFGNLANLQNSLNQNRLFQAKTLAGRYLEQSTGPDGQPDLGRFSQSLQGDPRTASFAPEILQDAATLFGTGIQNQKSQLDLKTAQQGNLRQIAASAGNTSTATDPEIRQQENIKNATAMITQAANSGVVPQDMAAQYLGSGDLTKDLISSSTIGGAGGEGAMEAAYGKGPTPISTNQGTQFVNPNRVTNQVSTTGGNESFIQNEPSPESLLTQIPVVNDDGSKSSHPLGEFIDKDTGLLKSGISAPRVDLGPLATTTRTSLGQAYGPAINDYENEVSRAPQVKTLIDQMRREGDQFAAGPHSAFWQNLGELANEYGVKVPGIDQSDLKTSSSEAFQKIIPDLLRAQAVRLGMNETDTGRQIASAAIPSNVTTPGGRNKLLSIVEGNEDMLMASGKLWEQQKAKHGVETYGNFRMDFPRAIPPSIFQSQYMTPQDKSAMLKDMTPTQQSDWQRKYDIAKQQGLLPNAQ